MKKVFAPEPFLMHSKTRQVIAMQVGPRDKQTTEKLFYKLPEPFKKKALYYTDLFSVYYETIPFLQHRAVGKESGKTYEKNSLFF